MRWFEFKSAPVFQDVVGKHTKYPQVIGTLGTVYGIVIAFRTLEAGNPLDLVAPGIIVPCLGPPSE